MRRSFLRHASPLLTRAARSRWVWAFCILAVLNAWIATSAIFLLFEPTDWRLFEELPGRLAAGTVYEAGPGYNWIYSPIMAWLVAVFVLPMGYEMWFALHAASLVLLRDWRLVTLAVLSLAFWVDTIIGNVFVFVAVIGVLAARGSKAGTLAFVLLFVLMPRPVTTPMALWLLWQRPYSRLPFAAAAVVTIAVTLTTGYLDDWYRAMLPFTQTLSWIGYFGPARFVGGWWVPAGLIIGALLTYRHHPGWAGLAVAPYVNATYFLILLVELVPRRPLKKALTVVGARTTREGDTRPRKRPARAAVGGGH